MILNKAQVDSRRKAMQADAQAIYQQLSNGQITEDVYNKEMTRLETAARRSTLPKQLTLKRRVLVHRRIQHEQLSAVRPRCSRRRRLDRLSKQLNAGNMHSAERYPYGSRQLSRLPSAYDMDSEEIDSLSGAFRAP